MNTNSPLAAYHRVRRVTILGPGDEPAVAHYRDVAHDWGIAPRVLPIDAGAEALFAAGSRPELLVVTQGRDDPFALVAAALDRDVHVIVEGLHGHGREPEVIGLHGLAWERGLVLRGGMAVARLAVMACVPADGLARPRLVTGQRRVAIAGRPTDLAAVLLDRRGVDRIAQALTFFETATLALLDVTLDDRGDGAVLSLTFDDGGQLNLVTRWDDGPPCDELNIGQEARLSDLAAPEGGRALLSAEADVEIPSVAVCRWALFGQVLGAITSVNATPPRVDLMALHVARALRAALAAGGTTTTIVFPR